MRLDDIVFIAGSSIRDNVYVRDIAGLTIFDSIISVGAGLRGQALVTGEALSDVFMSRLEAPSASAGVNLELDPAAAFGSALHGRLVFERCNVSAITVEDLDQLRIVDCAAGAVVYALSKSAVQFSKFYCWARVRQSSAFGLFLSVSGGAALSDFEIASGHYEACDSQGAILAATGAGSNLRHGRIHHAMFRDNGTGTPSAGLVLATSAAGTMRGVTVDHCHFVEEGGGNQTYGVEETGAGSDYNLVDHNVFQGNATAPYTLAGANSVADGNIIIP